MVLEDWQGGTLPVERGLDFFRGRSGVGGKAGGSLRGSLCPGGSGLSKKGSLKIRAPGGRQEGIRSQIRLRRPSFRKARPPMKRSPVPSSSQEAGSGVADTVPVPGSWPGFKEIVIVPDPTPPIPS